MNYSVQATSVYNKHGSINIKETNFDFGTTDKSEDSLANPAEVFLGAFSSCILKNVERFSKFMDFEYSSAEIIVQAVRIEKPPRLDEIEYKLTIYSKENQLNVNLLKRNIEKFGTIFNTVKASCKINGSIDVVSAG